DGNANLARRGSGSVVLVIAIAFAGVPACSSSGDLGESVHGAERDADGTTNAGGACGTGGEGPSGAGGTGGSAGTTAGRFFAQPNTWYEKVPASPKLNPNSASYVDYLLSQSTSLTVNASNGWSVPVWYAAPDTPTYTLN